MSSLVFDNKKNTGTSLKILIPDHFVDPYSRRSPPPLRQRLQAGSV